MIMGDIEKRDVTNRLKVVGFYFPSTSRLRNIIEGVDNEIKREKKSLSINICGFKFK